MERERARESQSLLRVLGGLRHLHGRELITEGGDERDSQLGSDLIRPEPEPCVHLLQDRLRSVVPVPKDGATTVIRRRPRSKPTTKPSSKKEKPSIMNTIRNAATADCRMEARVEIAKAVQHALAANAHRRVDATPSRPSSQLPGQLGAYDPTTRSIEVIASTSALVEGESLLTWDLERYLESLTVLWSHSADALPIGRAEDVTIDADGLKMRIV